MADKAGVHDTVEYTSPSTPVEARFDALGITKAAGIGDFGWWTSDAEIQRLITWGLGYQVKQFMPA